MTLSLTASESKFTLETEFLSTMKARCIVNWCDFSVLVTLTAIMSLFIALLYIFHARRLYFGENDARIAN